MLLVFILNTSFEAGAEVAQLSSKGLKTPKIGFLFSSVKYNQEEFIYFFMFQSKNKV